MARQRADAIVTILRGSQVYSSQTKTLHAVWPMSGFMITIPRQLKSPNAWNGRHWRYKHKESQDWQHDIGWSLLTPDAQQNGGVITLLYAWNQIPKMKRVCTERRKVTVTRLVPSARNFIRDDDNLRFAVKPLNDALKRLGLIRDDNRKWLEQPMPMQKVSGTRQWSTVIQIEAADCAVDA